MEIVPMEKVNRAIEQNHSTHSLSGGTHQQVPVISLFPDKRVAEMAVCPIPQCSRRAIDHRIARVVLPGQQIIGTGRQTDDLGMNCAIQQRRRAMIVNGAARPATIGIRSPRSWSQSDWQVGPMNQIGADSVTPMNTFMERIV